MKRFLLMFLMLFGAVLAVHAQRMISGTITDKSGAPVIGANVIVKGTKIGTATDVDGKYNITVPSGSNTLVVSYTGFNSKELAIGAGNIIDATIEEGVLLEETVVSAIGVQRNKSDVVYANQTVKSEDLNTTASRSTLNALQGKMAGIKIGQSSGAVGASTRVVLRGETSLTQGNNALIVVDGVPINNSNTSGGGGTGKDGDRDNYVDFGNRGNDINPDDIESVTVLKGPSATTLYGSRGGSGVILITTKKGKKADKPEISFTSTYSQEEVIQLFKYQEKWGSGYESCNGCGGSTKIFMGENFAWGSKFDGRLIPWTAVPFDPATHELIPLSNGKIEQLVRPYSAVKNNFKNFFDLGNTLRNNFSISQGTDRFNYFISYTNFNVNGIVMNTELKKHNFQVNIGSKLTEKLRSDFKVNYAKTNQRGATEGGYPFGYSSGTPAMAFVTQTPANIPFNELRDYNSPYHDFKGFYAQYSINPYYILDNQDVRNNVDNVIASTSLSYNPIPELTLTGKISTNFVSSYVTEKSPKFSYLSANTWADGELVDGGRGGNTFALGLYRESSSKTNDLIYDAIANYNKKLSSSFTLNTTLGWNSIEQSFRRVTGQTVGGIVVPGYYDLTNSVEAPLSRNASTKYRLFGFYLNNSIGFRDWVFLEYSARQDYSSTLPEGKRGFFYQAGGFSIKPTNLPNLSLGPVSSLKIRGGIGSAGKDAPLYRLNTYYSLNPTLLDLGDDFQIRFPYNGQTGATKGNSIGNPELKPELSITSEVGLDIGLLQDKINIEYTYYNINSKNQIVDVNIPWSSGFQFIPVNIGRMTNKGHELTVSLWPVKTQKVAWRVYGNWSQNKNKVEEILANDKNDDELAIYSSLVHFAGHGSLNLIAVEGQPFGTFKGTGFVKDDQGRIVVDANGNPRRSTELQYLGSYQPDFLYGFGTEFRFGSFTFNALLDGKKGGLFYSGTKLSTEFNGTAITTDIHDRQKFVVENSVTTSGEVNTKETSAYSYFRGLPAGAYLLDASFLKLREVSLFYSIPCKASSAFKSIQVGVFGRNLAFWLPAENTFADPEVGGVGGNSDAFGIETTTTPPSRSLGAEIRLKF